MYTIRVINEKGTIVLELKESEERKAFATANLVLSKAQDGLFGDGEKKVLAFDAYKHPIYCKTARHDSTSH